MALDSLDGCVRIGTEVTSSAHRGQRPLQRRDQAGEQLDRFCIACQDNIRCRYVQMQDIPDFLRQRAGATLSAAELFLQATFGSDAASDHGHVAY